MKICVLGAGTIGLSWVRRFADAGHEVIVCDPRPDLAAALESLPLADAAGPVSAEPDRVAALSGVDLVQESGPEQLAFKHQVVADFAAHAPGAALLLSSTSALLPSDIARDAADGVAARIAVGHPYNPPHLMPLVEVVPGERTAEATLTAAQDFYAGLGMAPAVLRREVPGFVGNRLQKALWSEAFRLVQDGVVSVRDLDTVMLNSLGLRLACVGIVEAAQMGGGPRGAEGLFDLLRDSFAKIDLGEPDWSREAMQPLYDEAEEAYGLPARPELVARRDARLKAVLEIRERLA